MIFKFLIRGSKDRLTSWLGPLNAEETARLGSKSLTNCRIADWTNQGSQVKMARAKKITANDYVMVLRYQGFVLVLWNKQTFFPANFSPSNLKTSLYRKSFQVRWIWRSFGLFLAPYCEYFGNIFSFFNFFTRCSSWRELQQCEFSLRKIKTFIGIDYIWVL